MKKKTKMGIKQSIVIGISIIIGFVLYGVISKIPEAMKVQRGYQMQIRMMEMVPKEITVNNGKLLYLPRISYKGLSINVGYEFYKYQDNKLIQINLTKNANKVK